MADAKNGNFLAHIADRVVNRPLMVMPDKLAVILQVMDGRINVDPSSFRDAAISATEDGKLPLPDASRYVGVYEPSDPNNPTAGRKPYRQTKDGTAIIPIIGSLVNRGSWIDALSNVSSYEKIKRDIGLAAADDSVKAIVMDMDSPGGEAIGAFEAADAVAAAAEKKPVIASANGLCCSAAYAIASRASRVVVSPSSLIGSIGVVMLHLDHSNMLHTAGIVPTLIHAGARKVDGTPYKPLTDEVKGELRSEIEKFMNLFVEGVATGRTAMTGEDIRATEARVFMGAEAVKVGLADAVGTFESIISELSSRGGSRSTSRQQAITTGKARAMNDKTYNQAEFDKAVADARTEGHAAGMSEGKTAGAKAANDRVAAVVGHEAFKGRADTALKMLTSTSMTADELTGVLATIPAGVAPAATAPAKPADRASEAAGGLALVSTGADGDAKPDTRSDFQKGKERAKALRERMAKV